MISSWVGNFGNMNFLLRVMSHPCAALLPLQTAAFLRSFLHFAQWCDLAKLFRSICESQTTRIKWKGRQVRSLFAFFISQFIHQWEDKVVHCLGFCAWQEEICWTATYECKVIVHSCSTLLVRKYYSKQYMQKGIINFNSPMNRNSLCYVATRLVMFLKGYCSLSVYAPIFGNSWLSS